MTYTEANCRKLVINYFPVFDEIRASTWKELDELRKTRVKIKDIYKEDLEKAFLDIYFKPRSICEKEIEVLNKFSLQQAITNSKNSI